MKRLVWLAALGAIALFLVFLVNQTAQVVSLASTIHPLFGRGVLIALLLIYAVTLIVPAVLIARLPRALGAPPPAGSAGHAVYWETLRTRLAANPLLRGEDLADVARAVRILDERAAAEIRRTAATVFVTTAISQNGRLDALMVLGVQSKLVWRIAHIYHQRPVWRELARLYGHVAVSVFLVSEIDDLELSQQIQPVVQAALGGSVAAMVPGLAAVSTLVLQSILEGTANAYLTLRVGAICQESCGALAPFDARRARRSASVKAAGWLGAIVKDSAGSVVDAIANAARRSGASAWERLSPFSKAARSE